MAWNVLDMLGIAAFAISGAIVAMEEEYDILGVIVLGMVTAFGGGVVRNLLIGIPVSTIWNQGVMLKIAVLSMIVFFVLPNDWIHRSKPWLNLFDAIGLSSFAIQGSLYASEMNQPLSAVLAAGVLTGIGGGMIRDVFAGRKPLVLREEVYAVWALLVAFIIGMHGVTAQSPVRMYGLFLATVILRMLSVFYKWKLPHRSLSNRPGQGVGGQA